MCCDPRNYDSKVVGECEECGSPVDVDGESTEICGYSPIICGECGCAPCDDSC